MPKPPEPLRADIRYGLGAGLVHRTLCRYLPQAQHLRHLLRDAPDGVD